MRSLRPLPFVRCLIVMVMAAAWFVASDHCALASVLTVRTLAAPAQESCPGHSQPKQKPAQGEQLPCCKSLVANTAPGKISAGYDTTFFVTRPFFPTDVLLVFVHPSNDSFELDTGPPGIRSFSELVLQRSLRAHAPPFLS